MCWVICAQHGNSTRESEFLFTSEMHEEMTGSLEEGSGGGSITRTRLPCVDSCWSQVTGMWVPSTSLSFI